MSIGKELAIQSQENGALQVYGSSEDMQSMVNRIMKVHPALAKMAPQQASSVAATAAQLAILMGASPLPSVNEIHITDKGQVMIGENYWLRRANEQGGVAWSIQPRPMSKDESELYGVGAEEVGAICCGFRIDSMREMMSYGVPFSELGNVIGAIGVAVASVKVKKTQYGGEYVEDAKTGRSAVWTAIKRARVDCLKKLFPYIPGERPKSLGEGLRYDDSGIIKMDYQMGGSEVMPAINTLPAGTTLADINASLFGDDVYIEDDYIEEEEAPAIEEAPVMLSGSKLKRLHVEGKRVFGERWKEAATAYMVATHDIESSTQLTAEQGQGFIDYLKVSKPMDSASIDAFIKALSATDESEEE